MRYWLRELRLSKNLTQKEAGKSCGISTAYWSALENGSRSPSLPKAMNIGKVFGFQYMRFYDHLSAGESDSIKNDAI